MSLLICSSGQEKYTTTGFQTLDNSNVLTSTSQAAGIQNPASFTNNINPVVKIAPNSEVALKSASYFKNKMFQIGSNTSFAFYFGQYLRSRYGLAPNLSLSETTNFPIPMPIPKGTYNMRTFANALSECFDTYISHPDLFRYCWVEPAAIQGDGINTKGLIFNFQQGQTDALTDASTELATSSVVNEWKTTTAEFAWVPATLRYTGSATADVDNNYGILETAPISQRGGTMTWNVENSKTSGFRIGLTRPTARDDRAEPEIFNSGGDIDVFFDYVLDFDGTTFRLYHCVEQGGSLVMKEITYYSNDKTHFTPNLDAGPYGFQYAAMHDGGLWTNAKAATASGSSPSTPKTVDFIVSGEDITIQYTDNNDDLFTLTDTRLCIAGNANVLAQTPTRNLFPKPTGLTTQALYAKVNTKENSGYLTLTQLDAPTHGSGTQSIFENGDSAQGIIYQYPQISDASVAGGRRSAGSSFWGRSQLEGGMKTDLIAKLVDRAEPYQSGLTTAQKQYVGLGGPDGETPPVRITEGDPLIPDPAVEDALGIAYCRSIVLVPSTEGVGANTIKGSYATETSDVSALFGFPNDTLLGSNRDQGSSYLAADAPTATSTAPPTNTLGAFHGWYVGSTDAPTFSRGQMFLRIPQFTHTSQNFGKGIPSKIISSLPPATDNGTAGEVYYEPANMTYVALNNPSELNINVLTLQVVDKQDQLVEGLSKSSTFVLHVRQKSKM